MLDDILFAPAHLFDQMEVERDFDSVWNTVQSLIPEGATIDEIFCRTGLMGQRCIASGYAWKGWDEDSEMLERVMLTRGFQYVGLGGWQQLPAGRSEVILGCFAPFSRIEPQRLNEFVRHLYDALQEKGCCLLQNWVIKEIKPLHRSYNGQKEKWVAMCVPKQEEQVMHFAWHWMGAKGKGPIKRFVEEDTRYIHTVNEIKEAAQSTGFTVSLQAGWWMLAK